MQWNFRRHSRNSNQRRKRQNVGGWFSATTRIFAKIVAKLDAECAAVSTPAVEALVRKHGRVLASIERLTGAVSAELRKDERDESYDYIEFGKDA